MQKTLSIGVRSFSDENQKVVSSNSMVSSGFLESPLYLVIRFELLRVPVERAVKTVAMVNFSQSTDDISSRYSHSIF